MKSDSVGLVGKSRWIEREWRNFYLTRSGSYPLFRKVLI
jgi:hypothetical protein